MKDITIFDKSFKSENTENYRLSIQLSLDGFSFTTLDTISNKFNSFYYESLDEGIDNDDYLSSIENFIEKDIFAKHYKDVSIILVTPQSTLIPASIFELNNLKKLYEFNQKLEEDCSINYNKLKCGEIYCLFTVPSFISTTLRNKFNNYKLYHQATPFIDDVITNYQTENPQVFVNIGRNMFDIIVTEKGKLKLFNTFTTKSPQDIVYFIINCYEQLNLDRKNIKLTLTGIYNLNSELIELLTRFINQIEHESLKRTDFVFEQIFKNIPVSRFPNLFKILKCE